MLYFIALGLLVAGVGGVSYLAFSKRDEVEMLEVKDSELFLLAKNYIRKAWRKMISILSGWVEDFSWNLIIQKMLSRARVNILKIDKMIAASLSRVRERSKKQKEREEYWKKVSGLVEDDEKPA